MTDRREDDATISISYYNVKWRRADALSPMICG